MVLAHDAILETRSLVKAFEGFVAVDGVSLRVRRGEIHALIGPNGAGKTTFFNLLTKFLQPTSGDIFFRGNNITREKPADIARLGIVRSFQICAVFPHLTVLENVRVSLQRSLGTSFHFWRSDKSLASLDHRALQLLTEVRLEEWAHTQAADLPYGRKRALELATTLALGVWTPVERFARHGAAGGHGGVVLARRAGPDIKRRRAGMQRFEPQPFRIVATARRAAGIPEVLRSSGAPRRHTAQDAAP